MPKERLPENKGLPKRWKFQHGAYYYRVPPGLEKLWDGKKMFRLGKTTPEAYRTWAQRLEHLDEVKTVGQLLERYSLEVIPTKAPATQTGNYQQLEKIRTVFGDMTLQTIEPQDIYKYVDKRGKLSAARKEIAILSHALTKAVEWGYIKQHPFKGEVRLEGEKPRTRYIEDWEVIECLKLPSMRKRGSVQSIQAYIGIKLLTGMRRGDMLRLRVSDLGDVGIRVNTNKTGKPLIYEWSEELRAAVDLALSTRPIQFSPFLFCNKNGLGYVNEKTGKAEGWNSMWQRFMDRVLSETKVTERFTEHDLRAKCASDAKTLEHARALLAHTDVKLTQRVYRRKPERVSPLR